MNSWRTNGLPEPIWVDKLNALDGLKEVVNGKLNPQVADMFKFTRYPLEQLTVKTAWCAAAVCFALETSGYKSTRSAAAHSYATYGLNVPPQYGAIAVFGPSVQDAGGTGHVTFIVGLDHDSFLCIGGNQSNTIKKSWYPKSRMVACRYPSAADLLAPA